MSDKAPQPFLDDKDVQVRALTALLEFHAEEVSQGNTALYVWSRVSYQSRKDNRNISNTAVGGAICMRGSVLKFIGFKIWQRENNEEFKRSGVSSNL